MTISAAKTTTKPTIEESLLPPKIMTALSMVASGTSYELAAKSVNMTAKQLRKWNKHKDTKDFLERVISEKLDLGTNKLVHNWHRYCDELDKAALDPKTKPYAKREVIQLIHQIIKDNVLERNQNRKIEEIKDALVSRENQNTLINITEI
jgi:uncharacterized membrane-anchored protein YjiN (DUF445 family)|tara:strand:+ start:585 stop:1034 length:450 start_codon:yes stop_codon:yes gene_type:complete